MVKEKHQRLQLKDLQPGDLVHVVWCDASIGVRMSGRPEAPVDVYVDTYGVYVGNVGVKTKQLIITQNNFQYSDGVFDIDYTSVPSVWIESLNMIKKAFMPVEVAKRIFECFIAPGQEHTARGIRRRRTKNHG